MVGQYWKFLVRCKLLEEVVFGLLTSALGGGVGFIELKSFAVMKLGETS